MFLHSLRRTLAVGLIAAGASTLALNGQTKQFASGVTTVTLNTGFVNALTSLKVAPAAIRPSSLADGNIDFPIVGGALDVKDDAGNVFHSGGLQLTAGSTSVQLQSFIIDTTGKAPVLTGLVSVDGKLVGRLTLFDISLPNGIAEPSGGFNWALIINRANLTLDPGAAAALNKVFGIKELKGGLAIGTAEVFGIFNNYGEW